MISKKNTKNFNQLMAELDGIIVDLQSSAIDVDKMMIKYKRATQLIKELKKYISEAKINVNKIKLD
jgi:exodeoxyribonuclease VII small subunit